ncbi:hypothetical protein MT997_10170 [Paenibacillus sp. OVF10]|nr:hypothetical protein MT997_10170 [Paenibacillus sp. OVF10]
MAFNRQISVFVFGRAVADVSGSAAAVGTMEMTGSAVMDVAIDRFTFTILEGDIIN